MDCLLLKVDICLAVIIMVVIAAIVIVFFFVMFCMTGYAIVHFMADQHQ